MQTMIANMRACHWHIKASYSSLQSHHLLSADFGRDLPCLPGQVFLPSADLCFLFPSCGGPGSPVKSAAQEGDGTHEPGSLDPHGARAVGQSNFFTSFGAWGRDSATQWPGIVRHGAAAWSMPGHRGNAVRRGCFQTQHLTDAVSHTGC